MKYNMQGCHFVVDLNNLKIFLLTLFPKILMCLFFRNVLLLDLSVYLFLFFTSFLLSFTYFLLAPFRFLLDLDLIVS